MLSYREMADQYAWLYTTLQAPTDAWDHIIPTDGAYVAVKRVEGTDYVMFRGSVTLLDWVEDFAHFAVPLETDALGGVHPGFFAGVVAVKSALEKVIGHKVVIVGHSLGAGHAAIYAGLRVAQSEPVASLVLFGAPKPGCQKLKNILSVVNGASFRNIDNSGQDLITEVPFTVPPLLAYQQAMPFMDVHEAPSAGDKWGPFRYHHFGLYCRALNCTSQQAKSLPV